MSFLSPFFISCLAFTIGIITAHLGLLAAFYSIIIGIYLITYYHYTLLKKKKFSYKLVFFNAVFFLFGYSYYFFYTHSWNQTIKKLIDHKKEFCGLVVEKKITEGSMTRLTLHCLFPNEVSGKYVYIYLKKKLVSINPGSYITVKGIITNPQKAGFSNYLDKEKIVGSIFTSQNCITVKKGQKSIASFLLEKKNLVRTIATSTMSQATKQLFELIFLGYKEESKQTILDQNFKSWGISHLLARSGLHLNLIITIVNMALNYIPLSWITKQIVILMIVFFYCLFTWSTIPIMRTFLTFLLITIMLISKKEYDHFNIFSIVWMIFLLINPLYLFFLDFQLTFILTGALIWLNKQQVFLKQSCLF